MRSTTRLKISPSSTTSFIYDILLQSLSQTIIRLKRQRNSLAPWFRLPVELKAQILMEDSYNLPRKDRIARTTNLSEVSVDWRAVAINTPRLWTALETEFFDLAELILARSKGVALDVDCTSRFSAAIIDAFSVQVPRWRTAQAETRDVATVTGHLYEPLPLLQTVILDSMKPMHSSRTFHFGGGLGLNPLKLTAIYPDNPQTCILSGLKHMVLEEMAIPEETLVRLLQACPVLEELRLKKLAYLDPEPWPGHATLTRPLLTKVELIELDGRMIPAPADVFDAENIRDLVLETSIGAPSIELPSPLTLARTVIQNSRVDNVMIKLRMSYAGLSARQGEATILCLELDVETPLAWFSGHFPSGTIDAPMELYLRPDDRYNLLDGAAQLPGLRKIVIEESLDTSHSELVIDFLLWLVELQDIDGVLRWPAPLLHEIYLDMLVPPADRLGEVLISLASRRGPGGSRGSHRRLGKWQRHRR